MSVGAAVAGPALQRHAVVAVESGCVTHHVHAYLVSSALYYTLSPKESLSFIDSKVMPPVHHGSDVTGGAGD